MYKYSLGISKVTEGHILTLVGNPWGLGCDSPSETWGEFHTVSSTTNTFSPTGCAGVFVLSLSAACSAVRTSGEPVSTPSPDINLGVAQTIKNLPAMQETQVQSLGQEDPLEEGMATHSSILAWRIPWTEEPGGLQSLGLRRVGHDWATNTITLYHLIHELWQLS